MVTLDELAAELAALSAEVDTLKTQVPTLEELRAVCEVSCLTSGTSAIVSRSSSFRKTIFVGGASPVKILGLYLSFEYFTIAESDTSYWYFSADIGAGASHTSVARRCTRATGADANGSITARVPWSFDAAVWGDSTLSPGQVLSLNLWPTGTPPAIVLPMTVGIRYAPQ